ncbi:hypothetical protein HBI12_092660 [Parastagonospora nodorum]|nr:hypothetical protein HBI12_092660 [Parastagonospora nodorum]
MTLINTQNPELGLFLNNEYVKGEGPELCFKNPKDQSDIPFRVNVASAADVDRAVHNARTAFIGEWASWTGERRGEALYKLAKLVDDNKHELAYLESICSGKALSGLLMEFDMMTEAIKYYAGWADKLKGESYSPEKGFYRIVKREPLGVCCGITAWNASLLFAAWKSVPALATGNVIIIKPSEKSPLGTVALAALYKKAGFPSGVFQVLVGAGDVGSLLSSHMDVDKISFTGSTAIGRRVQEASAKSNLKRVTLELGGKSPAIVFDNANLDQALAWVTAGITANAGQVCAATSRLFIQASIFDAFLERLQASFEAIAQNLGMDPLDPKSQYGPVVDQSQYDKISQIIQEGKKTNKVLTGGGDDSKGGNFIAPTIFVKPDKQAKVYREEVFGPVLCVQSFETEDEVVKEANDTEYGLSGAVFTRDIAQALRVSDRIRTGTISINCNLMVGPQTPMGGFKSSGIGREMGEEGLHHYTETKTIWISMS